MLKFKDQIEMFESNLQRNVLQCVKEQVQNKLTHFERVSQQFAKYFDQEDLNLVLRRKVDFSLMEQLD